MGRLMRVLLVGGLILWAGGQAMAQDGGAAALPPAVTIEAPLQPAVPAEDSDPGLPSAMVDPLAATPAPAIATAPAEATATTPAPAAARRTDLYSIVMHAHWVVQAVMALLAVAAFVALVIFIHKTAEFSLAFRRLTRTARTLAAASDLAGAAAAVGSRPGPGAEMIRAAQAELALAVAEPALRAGVRERTSSALARIDSAAAQRLRTGTGILASIGSLAPFIGLFGTVFGIMNSFLAIAETKTTNLAVVAPGIAEALLATAIGLAAAIPAVLVYNICARRLARYRHRLGDVAAAAERLQSRALDRLAAVG
ncbi:MAG: tonB-system energizer ExbB [Rhodobacteraceae bacterium]|nr:tonB-system energizer ExbB [Paracoccaceae bacterium]